MLVFLNTSREERDDPISVYGSILQFWKAVATHPKVTEFPRLVSSFGDLYRNIEEEQIKV
jgi:hypothetical protein